MTELTITKIGNSEGVILPKEMLARLKLSKGDKLHVSETPDGYSLTSYDPEFALQMDAAERVMREYRDALKKLAE